MALEEKRREGVKRGRRMSGRGLMGKGEAGARRVGTGRTGTCLEDVGCGIVWQRWVGCGSRLAGVVC